MFSYSQCLSLEYTQSI